MYNVQGSVTESLLAI